MFDAYTTSQAKERARFCVQQLKPWTCPKHPQVCALPLVGHTLAALHTAEGVAEVLTENVATASACAYVYRMHVAS